MAYENDDLFKKFKLKHHRLIQQHTLKDSSMNFSKVSLCGICNDKSTGIHYGLATCDSCKGFFKRTIQNKRKYHCSADGLCIIDKSLRHYCQSCRFKKCLIKGMILKSIPYDPIKLNISFNSLEQLSNIDILFDNLYPLLNHQIILTKESIKKLSCLLIDIFINWYHRLPFYSIMNIDINQFILNNQWSYYIVFIIFYFLKKNYSQENFYSYDKFYERIYYYTENTYLYTISKEILDEFIKFLLKSFHINITNIEFTLLSILLILQTNQINLKSIQDIYFKILYKYEYENFPTEQPNRYHRLLYLSQQIQSITELLLKHQRFYLPFLLIPN